MFAGIRRPLLAVAILLVLLPAGCRNAADVPDATSTAALTAATTAPTAAGMATAAATVTTGPQPTAVQEDVAPVTPAPEATAAPTPAPTAALGPDTPADEAIAALEGLSFDAFLEVSYRALLLRTPETVTELGVNPFAGIGNDRLNDLSDSYLRDTQRLESAILDLLRAYDRTGLPPEQQLSYDVFQWHLDDRVRGHPYLYHTYPLHHFLGSYHDNLLRLFTELHPLETAADAADYVARLGAVATQVDQLAAGLRIRRELGVVPPDFILTMTRSQLVGLLKMRGPDPSSIRPETLDVYSVFATRVAAIDGLEETERETLLAEALGAVETSFVPGFLQLLDEVAAMQAVATDDAGVWKLPDGDAYYAYTLRHETSTDLTAAEIHQLGLEEVTRITAEMEALFVALGYPEGISLREGMDRTVMEAGLYDVNSAAGQQAYIAATEALIAEAAEVTAAAFGLLPAGAVVVAGGPWGGYYVPGSADGSRPGAYHVSTEGGGSRPRFNMQTVAYHEAIPGHHTQIALAQELDLPTFRRYTTFNGYVEGWALYAERLAWEMGLYENRLYGDLGRLQLELLRAVRLVADTGIHALGWSRAEAQRYVEAATGSPSTVHEVDRYIVWPAQATGYKVGMLEILALRTAAQEALGEQFTLPAFHDIVLGDGSLPLGILRQRVDAYAGG